MSSLIELAAQRLEQLRGTGVPALESSTQAERTTTLPERTVGMASAPEHPQEPARRSQRVQLAIPKIIGAGLVARDDSRSPLAEQFRVIKRPLLRNAAALRAANDRHGNLIMVTSALPGEGKSFTATNLAMSIAAELDHTVLLVDADVARPSVPRVLGFEAGRGLLDVLEGRAELADVLLRTNVDKLAILPSGNPHPRATELLASESMSQLLDEMATRYADRVIIFDSPPLLLTTESSALASHMGQIVIVVQSDRTPHSAVERALAAIDSHPLRMLVLNQARGGSDRSAAYGYGVGYGYGYGYGDGPSPALRDGR